MNAEWERFAEQLRATYDVAYRDRLAVLHGRREAWADGVHAFSVEWGRLTATITPEIAEWLAHDRDPDQLDIEGPARMVAALSGLTPKSLRDAARVDGDDEYARRLLKEDE
jgi:hypothetical protein